MSNLQDTDLIVATVADMKAHHQEGLHVCKRFDGSGGMAALIEPDDSGSAGEFQIGRMDRQEGNWQKAHK